MRKHVRLSAAFLALFMFTLSAGCAEATSAPQGPLHETVVVAEGNELIYETWGSSQSFGTGDEVAIDWSNGVVTVDGLVHKPHPAKPDQDFAVDYLSGMYSAVPFIQDYIASHEGDLKQRWNEGYRAWISEREILLEQAKHGYFSKIAQGVAPEVAADESAKLLRESTLVASAERDTAAPSGSDHQMLLMKWRGLDQETFVSLDPHEEYASPSTWISRSQAEDLVHLLRRLESQAIPIRISLTYGNLSVRTGSLASQDVR